MNLRRVSVWSVISLCVAALWITDYLMGLHAPVRAQLGRESILAGFCSGEEEDGGGCEDVVKGEHGYVNLPWLVVETEEVQDAEGQTVRQAVTRIGRVAVPVAQIGQSYYIFMLVWFVLVGAPRLETRRWHILPLALAALAVCATAYYLFVMAVRLEQWCKLCLSLHAIDFLLCGFMVGLWPRKRAKHEASRSKGRPAEPSQAAPGVALGFRQVSATLLLALSLVAMSFLHREDQKRAAGVFAQVAQEQRSRARSEKNLRFLVSAYAGVPAVTIAPRETALTLGDPAAKHHLVMFTDLQCPGCRRFEANLEKQFLPLWRGQLKVTFRHFPLCRDCNEGSKLHHAQACNAAYAVEAARAVGGTEAGSRMRELILDRHADLRKAEFNQAGFKAFADEIGLDSLRFASEFEGPEVRRIVQEDLALGKSIGITGTPTVYVDGKRLFSSPLQVHNLHFWKELARRRVGHMPSQSQAGKNPESRSDSNGRGS